MTFQTLSLPELGWGQFFQAQLDPGEVAKAEPMRVSAVERGSATLIGRSGTRAVQDRNLPPLAVGDWLLTGADGRIIRLLERRTELTRRAAGTGRERQLIAANVTVMFIVTSCNDDFSLPRLERYLVLARQAEVDPVLVLTKADLCAAPEAYLQAARGLGPGLIAEALDGRAETAAARLAPWCGPAQTVVLAGSSGAGKSTLANTLCGAAQEVQAIREDDARGRHTTTARSLHRLSAGGWLIDTPGMREVQLADAGQGVDEVFAEISALARRCRFRNCTHGSEPGCAVTAAITAGEIEARRLDHWRKLAREDRFNSESLAEAHARNRAFGRMHRSAGAHKELGKWGK